MKKFIEKLVIWFVSFFNGTMEKEVLNQSEDKEVNKKDRLVWDKEKNTFVDGRGRVRGRQRTTSRKIAKQFEDFQRIKEMEGLLTRYERDKARTRVGLNKAWKEWRENDRRYQQIRREVLLRT